MPVLRSESHQSFWRSLDALNVTRLLIAALLFLIWGLDTPRLFYPLTFFTFFNICITYLGFAALFILIAIFHRQHFYAQLFTQIVVDIVIVCLLYMTAGGMRGGMAILFLFPLTSAAILVRTSIALFFASIVTIFLLADAFVRFFYWLTDASFTQAGLYGASFLSAVYIVNRMAAKLINQENLASRHEQALRMQEAISSIVIAEMEDGVMVVDQDGAIFACNPAAENMLGLSVKNAPTRLRLSDVAYLKPLRSAFETWRQSGEETTRAAGEATAYLVIKPAEELGTTTVLRREKPPPLGTHVKLRFARAATDPLLKGLSVIFLQDVAKIDDRAQQLKLASMGRLTASIAHEVRNPLAAISHASALFGEEAQTPNQHRLLKIVSDNVTRLNRMVEDILNLSRKAKTLELINLAEALDEIRRSLQEMHGVRPETIVFHVPGHYRVRFDPVHLREVILNLLNNALRYASGQPGSILIYTVQATPNRLELHVLDDGPPITPDVRAHLFEPFYTTSRTGTGLGLYLARELCSNNAAMLDYEFHPDPFDAESPRGRFVITFSETNLSQEGAST